MDSMDWIRCFLCVIFISAVDGYIRNQDNAWQSGGRRPTRDLGDNEVPDKDEDSIRMTEICANGGNKMKCSINETLEIGSIVCGGGSHACSPGTNETVFSVCHGQRTCATLGLRTMMDSYCGYLFDITRQIHVTYRCVTAAKISHPCKSNICHPDNKGLQCHNGGVIHIVGARCLNGVSPCSWPTYVSLYTLCESQDACAASGLKMMMPKYCNHHDKSKRNVHVDYICLPRHRIENSCDRNYKELTSRFGVMMNPGYISTTDSGMPSRQCYWLIRQHTGTTVMVTVHLAYRKAGMPNCNTQFLQVRYTECRTKSSRIRSFCDLKKVNQKIESCGDVYITSFLPPAIEDLSDRFLVSYTVVNNTKALSYIPLEEVTTCGADLPVMTSSTMSTHGPHVSGRNYGPKDSLFDYGDGQSKHDTEASEESELSGIPLRIKLVILYVFFGIVILALLIALVFVIISYRGIAQKGQYKVESSEKIALWKNDDTTQIEGVRHNSIAENSNPSEVTEIHTPGSQTDEGKHTVATVHNLSPTDGQKRASHLTGRFSSFRDSKDDEFNDGYNQYASYTSLTSDDIPIRSNRASNEKAKKGSGSAPEEQPLVLQNGTLSVPNGVEHYTINDDDYAIVRKPKKPANNVKETNVDDIDPTYDNLFDEEVVGFKPTSGPYDKNRDSGMEFNIRFSALNGWSDDL
ncbi:uncharacterized protein [Haliotis cracherodii]|uniref:uncharacterized protein n=1 Tax=Haliotis cracherodii TaxID=6455 RepID=UPI0039E79446